MNLILEFIHEHILAIDFALCILIWLVQVIIYPVLAVVSIDAFPRWHAIYCKRIAYFVLPLMLAQLFESAAACFFIGNTMIWLKFFCVLSVWVFTFLVSAPCHQKLSKSGKDIVLIERLVSTNWYRTVFWTLIVILSYYQY